MLYVLLYFVPQVLASERATMREVVDKHFADNWIISLYLGYTVDLSVVWAKFPAASKALEPTLEPDNVLKLASTAVANVPKLIEEVRHLLTEGVVTEDYVLDNTQKCLNVLRRANHTLRWVMLHSTSGSPKVQQVLAQIGFSKDPVLQLLLKTAQFESLLKSMFDRLLQEKQKRWDEALEDAAVRMEDLSNYFSGNAPLVRCKPNEQLQKWFANISQKVRELSYKDEVLAGRKIQQLIHALSEVEQFEEVDTQAQVKQFLEETRQQLWNMVRIVNILQDRVVELFIISDTSYVWQIIDQFVPLMQSIIQRNPRSVLSLRSTFIKLASLLQQTCVRINQVPNNPDLFSVSAFYSGQLVNFVRKVLDIIPRSMFEKMRAIVQIQTTRLLELPSRVEKETLLEVAAAPARFELASLTNDVAVFTQGMLSMDKTLFGIIQVDPKNLLEDGIRKELVRTIAHCMNDILVFPLPLRIEQFESVLEQLARTLNGYKRSFEYISDYVTVYGLKIWQEEFSRIINFFVEQECAVFLHQEIYYWQSQFWDEHIPIPLLEQGSAAAAAADAGKKKKKDPISGSKNFVGRLTHALLAHVDYRTAIYLDGYSAWYSRDGRELVGIRTFTLLLRSVGVFGLHGIDRLLSFVMVDLLQRFTQKLNPMLDDDPEKEKQRIKAGGKGLPLWQHLDQLDSVLNPTSVIPSGGGRLYEEITRRVDGVFPMLSNVVGRLGQAQLVRRQIANALHYSVRLESGLLSSSLQAFNDAVLADIQAHYANPEHKPYPPQENTLLTELSEYLQLSGMEDPLTKIYVAAELRAKHLPLLLALFVIQQLKAFEYDSVLRQLVCGKKHKEWFDFTPFVVGVLTLLKQFHSLHTQKFLSYMGQHVRSLVATLDQSEQKARKAATDYPDSLVNVLLFLEEFCNYGTLSRRVVEQYLPAFVLNSFGRSPKE